MFDTSQYELNLARELYWWRIRLIIASAVFAGIALIVGLMSKDWGYGAAAAILSVFVLYVPPLRRLLSTLHSTARASESAASQAKMRYVEISKMNYSKH